MKAFTPKMLRRLRAMLEMRGISHQTMCNPDGEVCTIVYYVKDDVGTVIERFMDVESLVCEQEWMDLPVLNNHKA